MKTSNRVITRSLLGSCTHAFGLIHLVVKLILPTFVNASVSFPADCADNTWGIGCNQTCSCDNSGLCNKASGNCECRSGFVGARCQYGEYASSIKPSAATTVANLCQNEFVRQIKTMYCFRHHWQANCLESELIPPSPAVATGELRQVGGGVV